ncbi:MAG: hypothetical protein ACTHOU_18365 [Aureliella sp.]
MFNRRMFVALAVCLAVSASSAFAGGNGGTKKDSTVRVVNNGTNTIYAFVDVDPALIQAAAGSNNPIAGFHNLGGREIAGGGNSSDFKVKAGNHRVIAVDIVAEAAAGDKTVLVQKGQTATVSFP